MKTAGPKWVKKANMWCVTWFDPKQKHPQTLEWFSTKEEAEKRIVELDK